MVIHLLRTCIKLLFCIFGRLPVFGGVRPIFVHVAMFWVKMRKDRHVFQFLIQRFQKMPIFGNFGKISISDNFLSNLETVWKVKTLPQPEDVLLQEMRGTAQLDVEYPVRIPIIHHTVHVVGRPARVWYHWTCIHNFYHHMLNRAEHAHIVIVLMNYYKIITIGLVFKLWNNFNLSPLYDWYDENE